MSASPLKVVTVPLEKLKSDPQNVRKHDGRNLGAITRSLDAFGQRKPLVCARANDGSLVVIAGNGTLEAARLLGWSEISVVEVPADWDADKARAYAIADNRTAELAEWDKVALSSALLELDAVGWSMETVGFEPVNPTETIDAVDAFSNLPDGDRPDATQMTFTLTLAQGELVKDALRQAIGRSDDTDTGNANKNGNALALIAEEWLRGLS